MIKVLLSDINKTITINVMVQMEVLKRKKWILIKRQAKNGKKTHFHAEYHLKKS